MEGDEDATEPVFRVVLEISWPVVDFRQHPKEFVSVLTSDFAVIISVEVVRDVGHTGVSVEGIDRASTEIEVIYSGKSGLFLGRVF